MGTSCVDEGEKLSLHGSIANQPCGQSYWQEDEEKITIHSITKDEVIFGRKLTLTRKIEVSKAENKFSIQDKIENTGSRKEAVEILYHMNMGYPLLDEDSIVTIPSVEVTARDEHAQEDIENWIHMEKPQGDYQERCYYHKFAGRDGKASIYQPKLHSGLEITFDAEKLDGFVEWKMMGYKMSF